MWCLIGLGGVFVGLAVLVLAGVPLRLPSLHPSYLLRGCIVIGLLLLAALMLSCGLAWRNI